MKTVRITLDITFDEDCDGDPKLWKWDRMLFINTDAGESVVVVSVEEQT